MADLTLDVAPREQTGKEVAKKMRREGLIPAIVYGAGKDPVPITVDTKSVTDLIRQSDRGIRSIFLLHLEGAKKSRHAMIKDMQVNPLTQRIDHIDFIRVLMDEVVKTTVPIHISGESKGQKEGGILDFQLRELHIECLPKDIPDEILAVVDDLEIGHVLRLSDLEIPGGVKVVDDLERPVISVAAPKAVEVEEEAEELAAEGEGEGEPEVIGKGKAEDEESSEE